MDKKAFVFPGVGYTKDRPLLYYAGKLAAAQGYELVHMDFSGIKWSKAELKDPVRFDEILKECLARTEKVYNKLLDAMDEKEDDIFISKSIGTVVATAFAKQKGLDVRQLCFTPLENIDDYVVDGNGLIYYGNADPYADPASIAAICERRKLEAYCIENANHSLETGDVLTDIVNIRTVMARVKEFISL